MDAEWDRLTPFLGILPAARVAMGSRGIDNLALVTRKVVDKLRQAGAKSRPWAPMEASRLRARSRCCPSRV